jgi:isopenicillin N synthase-like dioxygenase
MIPKLDAQKIKQRDADTMAQLKLGIESYGFLIVENTYISSAEILTVIDMYRAFFHLDPFEKARVDMAQTGSNRGWGAPQSEQVDPKANPDYKEVFDCGFEIDAGDPMAQYYVYAPNMWPRTPNGFKDMITGYYVKSMGVALDLLSAIADVLECDSSYFDDKFSKPMALLRGNYYPARPSWAGENDYGIAEHTDYGCVTLLASDGVAGLEAKTTSGDWIAITAEPGEFIINFGEMLEIWTNGRVRATPHRVRGTVQERISVPLFFNPNYDTNVAPWGAQETVSAGEHLTKRFNETYVHLKDGSQPKAVAKLAS